MGIGDAIAQAFFATIVVVAVFAVAATLAVVFGVRWLWALAKPWLHMLTA